MADKSFLLSSMSSSYIKAVKNARRLPTRLSQNGEIRFTLTAKWSLHIIAPLFDRLGHLKQIARRQMDPSCGDHREGIGSGEACEFPWYRSQDTVGIVEVE
jgi:hypothetical protein